MTGGLHGGPPNRTDRFQAERRCAKRRPPIVDMSFCPVPRGTSETGVSAGIVRTLAGSARTGFVRDACAGSIQLSTQTVDN